MLTYKQIQAMKPETMTLEDQKAVMEWVTHTNKQTRKIIFATIAIQLLALFWSVATYGQGASITMLEPSLIAHDGKGNYELIDEKPLPAYKVVKGDTLVVEYAKRYGHMGETVRFAYRYVPLDGYPASITRGQLKAILKRLDVIEERYRQSGVDTLPAKND